MMKARLLSTVAAATLLLSVGAASAQTTKRDEAPAPAPAVQQKAPAEKMAPALKPGEQKAGVKPSEKVGQAPKASGTDNTRATDKGAMDKSATGKPLDKGPAVKSDGRIQEPVRCQWQRQYEGQEREQRRLEVAPPAKARPPAPPSSRPSSTRRSPASSSSRRWRR